MNAVLTLALKDLKLLVRDRFALFWILAFPLMFALFFGAIFGGDGDGGRGAISLTIVDEDGSDGSRALVERLSSNESVTLTRIGDGDAAPIESPTLDEARALVQKGRRSAYLRIPAGFGDNPYAVFGASSGDDAELEIGIDPGRSAETGFLQGILMETVFGAVFDRFRDKPVVQADLADVRRKVSEADDIAPGQKLVLQTFFGALGLFLDQLDWDAMDGATATSDGTAASGDADRASDAAPHDTGDAKSGGGLAAPFHVVDVSRDTAGLPRSTWDITFPQALVWGLMSVSLGFAITLVRERTAGTLLRLRMAPIGHAQLLLGKGLGCFLACTLTMAVLLGFASLALGLRVDSLPLLLLAMVSTAICFTGIMMTVSVLGKTEAAVAGASWGVLMPFAMIGGGMIPLFAMPGWLAQVSVISPFKWAITSVEGAIWRGFTLGDMALPCAILIGTGALFFGIGVTVYKKLDG
ncbi:MAG: ABC transporter permease [Planctomycetes bacterium]|nr:ABC transporter permease [Planctomycetota bacterium]